MTSQMLKLNFKISSSNKLSLKIQNNITFKKKKKPPGLFITRKIIQIKEKGKH